MCRKKQNIWSAAVTIVMAIQMASSSYADTWNRQDEHSSKVDKRNLGNAVELIEEGKQIFRFDTFGDEAFWGGQLRLHEAIAGEANGGVGPGVSPKTALALGLKVDEKALPRKLRRQIMRGRVDLDDPATTLALLKLDAVVGVRGFFNQSGQLESIGISCALCHSCEGAQSAWGSHDRQWRSQAVALSSACGGKPLVRPYPRHRSGSL